MKNFRNKDRTENKYGIPYSPPDGKDFGEKVTIRSPEVWEQRRVDNVRKKLFTKQLARDTEHYPLSPKIPAPDLWDGQGLFIHGETGFGKTVLTASLLLDVKKHLWLNFQHKECLFTSVPELFARLKQSYDDPETNEWKILDEQKNTWLLVLDDLGVSGTPSDWLIERLYLLINHRWQNMLPTIITSNLDLNQLSDLLEGDRITSRIDRMSASFEKTHWSKGGG